MLSAKVPKPPSSRCVGILFVTRAGLVGMPWNEGSYAATIKLFWVSLSGKEETNKKEPYHGVVENKTSNEIGLFDEVHG